MAKNILNSFSLMRNSKLNYAIRAVLVMLLFTLGIGNAWGSATYKLQLKTVTQNNTGNGKVYATETNAAPEYSSYYTSTDGAYNAVEQGSKDYYLWAVPTRRGVVFNNWTTSFTQTNGASGGNSTLTDANKMQGAKVTVKAPTDASGTDTYTTTATVTANWNQHTKAVITYAKPTDGKYRVTYEYSYLNTSTNALETGFTFDMDGSSAARSEDSYNNDVITLQSLDGIFEGWYNGSTLLSKNNPYTYVAPASGGSVTISAHYTHVDKYYGKLTASIAEVPYSMPGGGTIFIANDPDISGTYSADAQSVSNETYGESQKYYLHAQPNDKRYVFRGWYSNPECTGTALSTNADYTYTFTASSMNSASPTTGNVYAAFDFNLYYMQVEAEPAVPGLGMVLVKDNNTGTPEYTDYTTHTEQFLYAYRLAPTANAYLYAKPKYGYKFSGWYDNPDCTGTVKSTANPYTYAATGTSTDPMNPTIIKLYAKFVEDASTVNITYNKPDQTKGEYTASVLDIAEVNDDFIWTFTQVFTSEGKTGNTTQAQHKTDVLRLEAQPKAGYGVTSWTIAGAAKTTPSQLYETTGTAAATYGVTFGDAKPFLVSTNSTQYATLREALTAVGNSGQITVVQNAYVPAGNYTIPNGVTLLVPFDEAQTLYTTKPGITQAAPSGQSAYCTLTLGEGANIKVNGAISVSAHQNKGQPYGGAVTGKYGKIELKEGANITLNSGSYLYCWGYITGAGSVDALNGSTVYEDFQITCWRGGSCASDMVGNAQKVFPLAQYAIQNIEARINFHYGSSETVYTGVTVKYVNPETSAKIIGTTDGLFQLSSGAVLSRWYNASVDRQMYELNGNASIGYVLINMYANIDSRNYVLPITNNMDITVKSGTLSCDNDFALLPGASITIDEGAKASLGSKSRLYVYDKSEWPETTTGYNYPGNVAFCKVAYTDTKITTARTYANMADAKLDVNGTLEISKAIYTTAGGANICSSEGTGLIVLKAAAGTENITYQAIQESNYVKEYVAVPITAAKLHNGDDSYTLTAGAVANDQFIYNKQQEKWLKNPKVVSWNANGGTTEASTLAYSEGSFVGELPAAYKDGYKLEGWYTAADGGTKIAPSTKVTANVTYYAHWTPKSYTITYRDNGGTAFSGTHVDSPKAPHPTTHTFGTATTLNNATKEHYTFGGWYRTPSCSGAVVTSIAASECKNITLYAKWTINTHKFAWNFDGGTPSGTYTEANNALAYGSAITYPSLSKTGYTFAGWSTNATSMPDADLTITASWTPILYTITWLNWDGSPLKDPTIETTIEYGGRPAYPTASPAPTREASDGKTYEWDGWTTGAYGAGAFYRIIDNLPVATVDADYYAHFRITAIDVASNSNISIGEDAEVTTTTVRVNGRLAVSSTLTTDDLILEATPSSSGTISGIENITVSSNAYFDYEFNVDPWHWSAFGVPFEIDLDAAAPLKEKTSPLGIVDPDDYDIVYYDTEERAANGASKNCWKYVDNETHRLIPGRLYMIAFDKHVGHVGTVRFKKAAGAPVNSTTPVQLITTGPAGGNNNWNGIANPMMYHALLGAGVTECQVHDGGEIGKDGYYTYDMNNRKFFVGKAAFVQVPQNQAPIVVTQATDENPIVHHAPRRAKLTTSQGTRYDVQIAPSEEEVADRLLVLTDEDKADEYVIVSDLAKAGVSPVRAQMWVDRYGEKLCKNTTSFINNKADYPIVISTPKAGEYDIFINDQPDDETMLYLTYDGEAIWNLSYGGYIANLEKGINTHYGLRIVRTPKITTGIEETSILNGDAIRKVIVDDKVLIIRGEKVYTIDGQMVK